MILWTFNSCGCKASHAYEVLNFTCQHLCPLLPRQLCRCPRNIWDGESSPSNHGATATFSCKQTLTRMWQILHSTWFGLTQSGISTELPLLAPAHSHLLFAPLKDCFTSTAPGKKSPFLAEHAMDPFPQETLCNHGQDWTFRSSWEGYVSPQDFKQRR